MTATRAVPKQPRRYIVYPVNAICLLGYDSLILLATQRARYLFQDNLSFHPMSRPHSHIHIPQNRVARLTPRRNHSDVLQSHSPTK